MFITLSFLEVHNAGAEPVSQQFQLYAGWNAIFLEVEPDDSKPATVFASLSPQLVSVWVWNSNAGTVEFIQNPEELTPDHPKYLSYFPDNPVLTNLHAINGNSAYLVNMSGPATLTVTGEPLPPRIDWQPNSFNLVGFHLQAGAEPIFGDYFDSFGEFHDSEGNFGEVYRLDNASGQWQQVLAIDQMTAGESVWVYCRGSSSFAAPFNLVLEQGQALDFATILTTQNIEFKNLKPADGGPIALELAAEDPVSDWLYYWQLDPATGTGQWLSLQQQPASLPIVIEPGEIERLRLGVKRSTLTPGEQALTNIAILDAQGTEVLLPAAVTGVPRSGLWVGQVVLNEANELHQDATSNTELATTGSEFSFRVIVHVDGAGNASLLKEVIQMWALDGDGPGAPVLIADDSYVQGDPPLFSPFLRDGREVGRRISTPAFGTLYAQDTPPATTMVSSKPMVATGSFGADGATLEVDLVLPANDPTNPFVHHYNPEHREPDINTPDEYRFEIIRSITLTFGDASGGADFIGWGSSDLGGTYEETIAGLHRDEVKIGGTFRLHKVSSVDTLWTP